MDTLKVTYSLCEEGADSMIVRRNTCRNCLRENTTRMLPDGDLMCDSCGWSFDPIEDLWDAMEPAPDLNALYADDPTVFKIPDVNLDSLYARITWLNNRAAKLGADPIDIAALEKITERVKQDDHGVKPIKIVHYTFVRVVGAPVKLEGGWTFAATLEHTEAGNIIRAIPGADIPLMYRVSDPDCDHCQLDRNRKDTYIVADDAGSFMQVGRTCLKDFVGHRDPARIAAWLEYIAELSGYITEEFMGGRIQPTGVDAEHFLGLTVACIRLWGWISSGKSRDTGVSSTKNDVMYWLDQADKGRTTPPNHKLHDKDGKPVSTRNGTPVETMGSDFAFGRAALRWARDLSDDDMGTSNYLYNLKVVAQLDGFIWRQLGLAASLVSAYQRYLGDTVKRLDAPESHYQGEVKKRQHWTGLTCTDIYDWDSQYGMTHLHKFTDADGNIFVWKTGSYRLDQGATYHGKATVKAHDEYKGIKQTVITRFAWDYDETANAGEEE